jgi:hypothetical protein
LHANAIHGLQQIAPVLAQDADHTRLEQPVTRWRSPSDIAQLPGLPVVPRCGPPSNGKYLKGPREHHLNRPDSALTPATATAKFSFAYNRKAHALGRMHRRSKPGKK